MNGCVCEWHIMYPVYVLCVERHGLVYLFNGTICTQFLYCVFKDMGWSVCSFEMGMSVGSK